MLKEVYILVSHILGAGKICVIALKLLHTFYKKWVVE